jgi:hypothetical protein
MYVVFAFFGGHGSCSRFSTRKVQDFGDGHLGLETLARVLRIMLVSSVECFYSKSREDFTVVPK